ncbi:MAG: Txe/YoeB family addiction module toxin [Sulfuricurvum sp.]
MVEYKILYSKEVQKDAKNFSAAGLADKAKELIEIIEYNPFQIPPGYEKLVGDLSGAYSLWINIKHRLVYQVMEESKTVRILRMWSYYGE